MIKACSDGEEQHGLAVALLLLYTTAAAASQSRSKIKVHTSAASVLQPCHSAAAQVMPCVYSGVLQASLLL
jgi:hypothetical protein